MTPAPAPPPFAMRLYWQSLGLIALFALWPYLLVYAAAVVADLGRCTILGSGPLPCPILGADRGGLLYAMASMAELGGLTLPVGALLALFWLGAFGLGLMAYRRRRAGAADATRMAVNFGYYGLALALILALGLATLSGWLPAPVLLLVSFAGIFWTFSFVFALLSRLRAGAAAK